MPRSICLHGHDDPGFDGVLFCTILGNHRLTTLLTLRPELLQLLDKFLPRINFGRPVPSAGLSPNISVATGSQENTKAPSIASATDHHGFAYLKRDLVRMLGILCHEKKAVQDRTREAGGIEVIMNMCVIDDRNPCESVFSAEIFCHESCVS